MPALIATTWSPALDLGTHQTLGVLIGACLAIAAQPTLRIKAERVADWLVIVGTPFLSVLAYLFWGANFLLMDGRNYGLPIHIRSFASADDFLSTYVVIGTGFLLTRRVTGSSHLLVRLLAWCEVSFFGLLLGIEVSLLALRLRS